MLGFCGSWGINELPQKLLGPCLRHYRAVVECANKNTAARVRRRTPQWLEDSKRHSANFIEIAVTAEAVLEARGAVDAVADQCFASVVPFLNQRIAHRQAVAS